MIIINAKSLLKLQNTNDSLWWAYAHRTDVFSLSLPQLYRILRSFRGFWISLVLPLQLLTKSCRPLFSLWFAKKVQTFLTYSFMRKSQWGNSVFLLIKTGISLHEMCRWKKSRLELTSASDERRHQRCSWRS